MLSIAILQSIISGGSYEERADKPPASEEEQEDSAFEDAWWCWAPLSADDDDDEESDDGCGGGEGSQITVDRSSYLSAGRVSTDVRARGELDEEEERRSEREEEGSCCASEAKVFKEKIQQYLKEQDPQLNEKLDEKNAQQKAIAKDVEELKQARLIEHETDEKENGSLQREGQPLKTHHQQLPFSQEQMNESNPAAVMAGRDLLNRKKHGTRRVTRGGKQVGGHEMSHNAQVDDRCRSYNDYTLSGGTPDSDANEIMGGWKNVGRHHSLNEPFPACTCSKWDAGRRSSCFFSHAAAAESTNWQMQYDDEECKSYYGGPRAGRDYCIDEEASSPFLPRVRSQAAGFGPRHSCSSDFAATTAGSSRSDAGQEQARVGRRPSSFHDFRGGAACSSKDDYGPASSWRRRSRFHTTTSPSSSASPPTAGGGSHTYYKVLGLEQGPDATAAEIRAAYRRLVLKFHPDKQRKVADAKDCDTASASSSSSSSPSSTAGMFHLISEAYEVLGDEARRKEYDMKLTLSLRRGQQQW